jgi:cytidine deaminase
MQRTNNLKKDSLEILERAKNHARKTYRENATSIAAILKTKTGNYYTGINIKYKNIWKCICAEKVAIAKAIENNDSELEEIASVKYFPETKSYQVINMCGECLQIAINYPSLNVTVDDKGTLKNISIKKVFPFPYIR